MLFKDLPCRRSLSLMIPEARAHSSLPAAQAPSPIPSPLGARRHGRPVPGGRHVCFATTVQRRVIRYFCMQQPTRIWQLQSCFAKVLGPQDQVLRKSFRPSIHSGCTAAADKDTEGTKELQVLLPSSSVTLWLKPTGNGVAQWDRAALKYASNSCRARA